MNNIKKNKLNYKAMNYLLLSFIVSNMASVNAANVNQIDFFKEDPLNISKDMPKNNKEIKKKNKDNYDLIVKLIKQKKYEEANKKIDQSLKKTSIASYYNLQGFLNIQTKKLPEAKKSFLKAIELEPNNVQALTNLATRELSEKNFGQAKQYADKALLANPYNIIAYQVLADIAMQKKGIDNAESVLLNAHDKVKFNLQAELTILQSLMKIYVIKEQPEKLLVLALELIKRHQQKPEALLFLADAQLINKAETAAEKTLRQILSTSPNNAIALFRLARLLNNQGNKEDEILSLLDKAAVNLNNPSLVLAYKTGIFIKRQKYSDALITAKKVDKLNSGYSIGKKLIADIYLAEKKYLLAQNYYQLAYKITPNINQLDNVLKILTLQNKYNDVITLLKDEIINKKENTALKFRLAVAYQNANQNKLAIKLYNEVLKKQKNNVIALNNLAWIYSHEHDPRALITAKKAYDIAKKSSVIADTYGYMLLLKGNNYKSIKVLEQGLNLEKVSPMLKLHLAEAYIANKEITKAQSLLKILVNEQSEATKKAIKLLKKYPIT